MKGGSLGNSQNLQTKQFGYSQQCQSSILVPGAGKQLLLHSISAYNGNAIVCDIGLGIKLASQNWKLWLIGASTVDNTSLIQAGSAVSLYDTTNTHGYLVQSSEQFGVISFNVSQAQTGSPVYTYQYWNGTAWTALTLSNTPTYTGTGQKVLAFNPPIDWALGSGVTGADANKYSIRLLASTAPSQAVQANSMLVAKWIAFRGAIAANQQLQVVFRTRAFLCDSLEEVIPYFSVANAANTVEVSYQNNG